MKAPSRPDSGDSRPGGIPDRDKRLADALRENLRRRKAQARAKQGSAKTTEDGESRPANPPVSLPERNPSE
jgi:hypothetical protein